MLLTQLANGWQLYCPVVHSSKSSKGKANNKHKFWILHLQYITRYRCKAPVLHHASHSRIAHVNTHAKRTHHATLLSHRTLICKFLITNANFLCNIILTSTTTVTRERTNRVDTSHGWWTNVQFTLIYIWRKIKAQHHMKRENIIVK